MVILHAARDVFFCCLLHARSRLRRRRRRPLSPSRHALGWCGARTRRGWRWERGWPRMVKRAPTPAQRRTPPVWAATASQRRVSVHHAQRPTAAPTPQISPLPGPARDARDRLRGNDDGSVGNVAAALGCPCALLWLLSGIVRRSSGPSRTRGTTSASPGSVSCSPCPLRPPRSGEGQRARSALAPPASPARGAGERCRRRAHANHPACAVRSRPPTCADGLACATRTCGTDAGGDRTLSRPGSHGGRSWPGCGSSVAAAHERGGERRALCALRATAIPSARAGHVASAAAQAPARVLSFVRSLAVP